MDKDKTVVLEKTEKKKRVKKGSSASYAPPPDWIHDDWLSLKVTEKQVRDLVADGLVPEDGWRFPDDDESERRFR